MAFRYEGIQFDQLRTLWPTMIDDKLSSQVTIPLEKLFDSIFSVENDTKMDSLTKFVQHCCEYKPVNFEEYISYAVIAISVALLQMPAEFRPKKSQLMAHTFGTNVNCWSCDQNKVSSTHTVC